MQYRPRSQQDLTTDTIKPKDVIHRGILDERIKAVLDCGDNVVTTWIVDVHTCPARQMCPSPLGKAPWCIAQWAARTRRRSDQGQIF